MARYQKGQSGNPTGKKAGTKNLTTREAREILNRILYAELDNIKDSLSEIRLNDKAKYLEILSKLLSYSLPRKTDVTTDDESLPRGLNIVVGSQQEKVEMENLLNSLKETG